MNTEFHYMFSYPDGVSHEDGYLVVSGTMPPDAEMRIHVACARRRMPRDWMNLPMDSKIEVDGVFDPRDVGLLAVANDGLNEFWHEFVKIVPTDRTPSHGAPSLAQLVRRFEAASSKWQNENDRSSILLLSEERKAIEDLIAALGHHPVPATASWRLRLARQIEDDDAKISRLTPHL